MVIQARFRSQCPACEQPIQLGEQVEWERGRKASHVQCPEVFDSPEALEYQDQSAADELTIADAADRLLFEYAAALRLSNLEQLQKGIYRVSLTGAEARHGIDYVNLNLVPSEQYGSVKISQYSGESIGCITRHGELRLWPEVDPASAFVKAMLAAVEILLGSADLLQYARAWSIAASCCWRCGAPLVDQVSRARLLGPHCWKAAGRPEGRPEGAEEAWVPAEVDDDQALDSDPYDIDIAS